MHRLLGSEGPPTSDDDESRCSLDEEERRGASPLGGHGRDPDPTEDDVTDEMDAAVRTSFLALFRTETGRQVSERFVEV